MQVTLAGLRSELVQPKMCKEPVTADMLRAMVDLVGQEPLHLHQTIHLMQPGTFVSSKEQYLYMYVVIHGSCIRQHLGIRLMHPSNMIFIEVCLRG